jgi:trigger factor
MLNRASAELRSRGVKPEDTTLSPDAFRPQAEERVALGLILNEIVRAHGLQAKPEQVRALIAETAQSYEQPDAVIRWHYEKPERLNEFELVAVEHNVVEWMLGHAQVDDAPRSFAELMEPAAG